MAATKDENGAPADSVPGRQAADTLSHLSGASRSSHWGRRHSLSHSPSVIDSGRVLYPKARPTSSMTSTNSFKFVTCRYADPSCKAKRRTANPERTVTSWPDSIQLHLLCSNIRKHCDGLWCLTGHLDAVPCICCLPELAPQLWGPEAWQRLFVRVPALATQHASHSRYQPSRGAYLVPHVLRFVLSRKLSTAVQPTAETAEC